MVNKMYFSTVTKNEKKGDISLKSDMNRLFSVSNVSSYGKNIEEQYQEYKKEEKLVASLNIKP